jgi:hypothetical protein
MRTCHSQQLHRSVGGCACALFGSCRFVTVTNSSFNTRWSVFRFGGGVAKTFPSQIACCTKSMDAPSSFMAVLGRALRTYRFPTFIGRCNQPHSHQHRLVLATEPAVRSGSQTDATGGVPAIACSSQTELRTCRGTQYFIQQHSWHGHDQPARIAGCIVPQRLPTRRRPLVHHLEQRRQFDSREHIL